MLAHLPQMAKRINQARRMKDGHDRDPLGMFSGNPGERGFVGFDHGQQFGTAARRRHAPGRYHGAGTS